MKRRALIDNGVGEIRAAIYEDDNLVEFHLDRWSEKNVPKTGDIYAGRVITVDHSLGGVFLDMGKTQSGFLKFTEASGAPRLHEGQLIDVRVSREPEGLNKGCVVKYLGQSSNTKPSCIRKASFEDRIKARFEGQLIIEYSAISQIYEAVDQEIALAGGGSISIEQTRALLAIDVDKGHSSSGYEAAISAAHMIPKQLRLRGLGGLVVIDFPNLRQKKQRDQVWSILSDGFKSDPNSVNIAHFSRFGAVELTRQKPSRSLDQHLCTPTGLITVETQSMIALQRLEREGRVNPGAQLELLLPHDVYNWLKADNIAWKSAMTDRLGARFKLSIHSEIDVRVIS